MQQKVCRRCLMRELLDQQAYERTIERARLALSPAVRTPQEEYERRLALCGQCEHLQNGTCMRCGCIAEMRAMRRDSHCPPPLKRW